MDKLDQVHQFTIDGMNAFKKLDRDGNGYVSDSELKFALSESSLPAHDRLLYEFLDHNYATISASSQDHNPKLGIDHADLLELELATDSSTPLSSRAKQLLGVNPIARVAEDLSGATAGATLAVSLGGDALALASTPIGWVVAGGAAVGAIAFEGVRLYRQKYDESNLTKLADVAKVLST